MSPLSCGSGLKSEYPIINKGLPISMECITEILHFNFKNIKHPFLGLEFPQKVDTRLSEIVHWFKLIWG